MDGRRLAGPFSSGAAAEPKEAPGGEHWARVSQQGGYKLRGSLAIRNYRFGSPGRGPGPTQIGPKGAGIGPQGPEKASIFIGRADEMVPGPAEVGNHFGQH